ncbi:MAG: DUF1844 domain-containing protein [Gemmatimonadota bacterium]
MNAYFASLVMGLGAQIEQVLQGKLPPGAEQVPGATPRQIAQTLIDTLGMLQEKTQGRLDADEEKLLTEVLTSLRFRFVQTASPPAGGSH